MATGRKKRLPLEGARTVQERGAEDEEVARVHWPWQHRPTRKWLLGFLPPPPGRLCGSVAVPGATLGLTDDARPGGVAGRREAPLGEPIRQGNREGQSAGGSADRFADEVGSGVLTIKCAKR